MVHSLLAVAPTLVVPAFCNAPMGAASAYVEAFFRDRRRGRLATIALIAFCFVALWVLPYVL